MLVAKTMPTVIAPVRPPPDYTLAYNRVPLPIYELNVWSMLTPFSLPERPMQAFALASMVAIADAP